MKLELENHQHGPVREDKMGRYYTARSCHSEATKLEWCDCTYPCTIDLSFL